MVRINILFYLAISMMFAGPKYHDDRLMVYIDDSVTDLNISNDNGPD